MSIRPTCLRLSLCISMQFPFHYLWLFYPRQEKKRHGLHLHTYPHSNQPHKSCICTESPPHRAHIYTNMSVCERLDIHVCTIVMGFLVSWGGNVRGECLSMPQRIEWETGLPLSVNKPGQEAVISDGLHTRTLYINIEYGPRVFYLAFFYF